jgi:hypothetical protein
VAVSAGKLVTQLQSTGGRARAEMEKIKAARMTDENHTILFLLIKDFPMVDHTPASFKLTPQKISLNSSRHSRGY